MSWFKIVLFLVSALIAGILAIGCEEEFVDFTSEVSSETFYNKAEKPQPKSLDDLNRHKSNREILDEGRENAVRMTKTNYGSGNVKYEYYDTSGEVYWQWYDANGHEIKNGRPRGQTANYKLKEMYAKLPEETLPDFIDESRAERLRREQPDKYPPQPKPSKSGGHPAPSPAPANAAEPESDPFDAFEDAFDKELTEELEREEEQIDGPRPEDEDGHFAPP